MVTKTTLQFSAILKLILVGFFTLLGFGLLIAQPANDDCWSAIVVSSTPYNIIANNINATSSVGTPTPTCANYQGGDVWYEFTPSSSGTYSIYCSTDPGSAITDLGMEIYSGSCGSLLQIDCDDDSANDLFPLLSPSLNAGSKIYIRIWAYDNAQSGTFVFDLSASPPPTPPANDDCIFGAELVNHRQLCQPVSGSSQFATESETGCIGTADDDVWYGFIATNTSAQIEVSGNGNYDAVLQFFPDCNTGGTCVNNTSTGGTETYLATGLVVGVVYYYRIFDFFPSNDPPADWTFTTCVSGGAPPPSNDECTNPIALPVSSSTDCSSTSSGTVVAATPSNQGVSCLAQAEFDDDVWFSFVASSSSHIVSLENISGGFLSSLILQVTNGLCVMNPTEIECQSDAGFAGAKFRVDGLTTGSSYFVRVASAGTSTEYILFDICIQTPPPSPANDECTNPISIPVSATTCTSQIQGGVTGATQSVQNSCDPDSFDDDVWFSFTALATSHVIEFSNFQGDYFGHVVQVTDGVCSLNPAEIDCGSNNIKAIDGLVVGQTYFIRVASESNWYREFTFDLCIRTIPIPINDECSNAKFLSSSGANCGTLVSGTITGATSSSENSDCGPLVDDFDDDVWFYFQGTPAATYIIEIQNIVGTTSDLIFEILGGSCGSLMNIECYDEPNNRFEISGLPSTGNYFIRVATYTTSYHETSFDICIRNPITVPNDECSGSLQLPVSTGASCASQINGSFLDATSSANNPNCEFLQDVWYFFVAQQSNHTVHLEGLEYDDLGLYYELQSGTSCGALSPLECGVVLSSTGVTEIVLQNLTPNSVYFLKIGHGQSSPFVFSDFTICIKGEVPTCTNVVSNTAASGPGSLRDAIQCADMGEEITFAPALNGQTIELDLPEIVIDKQLKFMADIADDISIGNFDANNTSRLLFIENALTIEGLKIEGKNAESMLWEIASGGSLNVINGELILVTVNRE